MGIYEHYKQRGKEVRRFIDHLKVGWRPPIQGQRISEPTELGEKIYIFFHVSIFKLSQVVCFQHAYLSNVLASESETMQGYMCFPLPSEQTGISYTTSLN